MAIRSTRRLDTGTSAHPPHLGAGALALSSFARRSHGPQVAETRCLPRSGGTDPKGRRRRLVHISICISLNVVIAVSGYLSRWDRGKSGRLGRLLCRETSIASAKLNPTALAPLTGTQDLLHVCHSAGHDSPCISSRCHIDTDRSFLSKNPRRGPSSAQTLACSSQGSQDERPSSASGFAVAFSVCLNRFAQSPHLSDQRAISHS